MLVPGGIKEEASEPEEGLPCSVSAHHPRAVHTWHTGILVSNTQEQWLVKKGRPDRAQGSEHVREGLAQNLLCDKTCNHAGTRMGLPLIDPAH